MNRQDQREEYREVRITDLSGGVNNSHNETLIEPNQTPDALNVEFDNDAVTSTGGAIKFNNQVAPGSAVRTRVDPSLSPLLVCSTPLSGTGNGLLGACEVPLRGYEYLPYCVDYDIGGRFTSEGDFLGGTEVFHIRRGRDFEINASFLIPPEEKLYEAPTEGSGAPATKTTYNPDNGFDEALDECFCILQKGGDRTAPMSWALAVVNVGNGFGLTSLPASRPSNYALCWIWYDAPQWGECSPGSMKYNLTTGQAVIGGAASQFSTQAYRAILIHKYVEPGKRYSVAVQLKMDTGSCGTTATPTNTAWNADGTFKVWVSEDAGPATSYTYVDSTATATGMEVVRGPTDGLSYLARYGIRYAGRDAMFGGLGYRFAPWMRCGFIPFGMDGAPLRSGGFQMVDRSANTVAALYGAGTYTLTTAHTSGDAYVVLNQQYLATGDVNFGVDPKGRDTGGGFTQWAGIGAAAASNWNALRGYRLVGTNNWVAAGRGAIATILDYTESGASYRLNIVNGSTAGKWPTWAAAPTVVQCFRWHQRDLVIGQVRIWSAPRAYDSATAIDACRRRLSLHSSLRLDDLTEPDIGTLLAYWPMDDAEGALLREHVVGGSRNGFLAPFGNGVTEGGSRGEKQVFLSGEGEALTLDLSEDPTFQREIAKMIAGSAQGFGFELTMVPTEAFYGIQSTENLPDTTSTITGTRPRLVPDLMCWDVKDATTTGLRAVPRPLLTLSHRTLLASTDPRPCQRPMGFGVAVGRASDQEDSDEMVPSDLQPWWRDSAAASHNRYDLTAPWVGRTVTIQVGIQQTGSADTYDVYIAMSPKDAFMPMNGDPSDSEFAYWTDGVIGASGTPYENNGYYTAAHLTITRKDLVRSVLTVGGRWNCKSKPSASGNMGYPELQARMLVDEVRWFATSPAGALPAASGSAVVARNGKLEGTNCLPPRLLTSDELLGALGNGLKAANVQQGVGTVIPPGGTAFYTSNPWDSERAVKGAYFYVTGDEMTVKKTQTFGTTVKDWYWISSVGTGGVSLSLASGYLDPTRNGVVAGAFRVVGYSGFEDDVRDKPLTLGRGKSYGAGSNVSVADVILTDELWENLAVPGGGWKLRIYSPLGRSSTSEILPQWTRGLVSERRGPDDGILGVYGFNERIYAGVRGALHEADDRWVEDGPTEDIEKSLRFRARSLPAGITAGLHDDRVEFTSVSSARLSFSATDAYVYWVEARVRLTEIGEYQTVLWIGDPTTNPVLPAGASGHKFQYALRLNRGRPEFVVGSTSTYDGTNVPEKGLYSATAMQALAPGEWAHVRFYLKTNTNGTILEVPWCKINGKSTGVRTNAKDNGVSGTYDWMLTANIVAPGSGGRAIVGIGRDSYRAPNADMSFSSAAVSGTNKVPQRIQGFLHSLNGDLAEVVVTKQYTTFTSSVGPADFDPTNISYSSAGAEISFQILGKDTDGIGHKVYDSAVGQYGVIRSHPFVSVYHEFGMTDEPIAWAEYGSQLYAANGGKPAVIIDGVGYPAGVIAPTVAPSFTVERFPLWKRNTRSGSSDLNDPLVAASATAAKQAYHMNTVGNSYLVQSLTAGDATAMSWDKDDYFCLKMLVRPRTVAGRQQLWRRGTSSKNGGPFLDIVDGKCRFGWWDLDLKEEVYVETSAPVFEAGCVHYVYVRKRWPTSDGIETNWQNSYISNGLVRRTVTTGTTLPNFSPGDTITGNLGHTGIITKANGRTIEYILSGGSAAFGAAEFLNADANLVHGNASYVRPMNDVLQVRRFRRQAETNLVFNQVNPGAGIRHRWSYTTNTLGQVPFTTATGLVTPPGDVFWGAAAGIVNSINSTFSTDMVGLFWEWGTGTGTVRGKRYRITQVNSAAQIKVADEELGTNPDFSAIVVGAPKVGGAFSGVALNTSTNFLNSKTPDNTQTSVEFLGSESQGLTTSEYTPFDGEAYTPGWVVAAGSVVGVSTENAQCFETLNTSSGGAAGNDPITDGTDEFGAENWDATTGSPGPLQYNIASTFWCADARVYGTGAVVADTSQPNTNIKWTQGGDVDGAATSAADPVWNYIQAPATWAASRQLAVAFYDKTQNLVGDCSPQLTIKPASEDTANPSGAVRIRLTNLPVGRYPSDLWVYESVANGSSGSLFRVATVANGTAEVALRFTDAETALGPVLEFTNAEPPRCEIVATSGSRLIYGALEIQPDACVASKVGFPGSVDYSKTFRLNSGFGEKVTGLIDIDTSLIAFKRRAVASVTFNATNDAIVNAVGSGTGAVAHATVKAQNGIIIFMSDKGMQAMARGPGTNLGIPQWIGDDVRVLFSEQVEQKEVRRAIACLNQKRKQYVLVFNYADEPHQFGRLTLEMSPDNNSMRYGLLEQPNITAITSVQSKIGGVERMVAGTEEGFVVWLDDPRSAQCMTGNNGAIWGYQVFSAGGITSTTGTSSTEAQRIDCTLEGPRGAIMRWVDVAGNVKEVVALGADNTTANAAYVLFADVMDQAPIANQSIAQGCPRYRWESGWLDMGNPERMKTIMLLDLIFKKETSGELQVDVYADFDEDRSLQTTMLDLSKGQHRVDFSGVEGRHVKVLLSTPPLAYEVKFELASMVWRVSDTDQN